MRRTVKMAEGPHGVQFLKKSAAALKAVPKNSSSSHKPAVIPEEKKTVLKLASSRDVRAITQDDLRAFYQLEQKYMDVKAQYLAQMAKIALRISNGAHQAPGKYAVRPKITFRRTISYKSELIKVKGKNYVLNLIEHTQPVQHTRLEFEDIGRN